MVELCESRARRLRASSQVLLHSDSCASNAKACIHNDCLHRAPFRQVSTFQFNTPSCSQLQEGDFAKDLVQEVLQQLGAGGRDLPQQFIKMGMQGVHLHMSSKWKPRSCLATPLSRATPSQYGMHLLTGFYRLLKTWGMDPGLEFKVAMEEAELLRARIVFGDADQDRTMRRISESLSLQACYCQFPA